MHWKQSCICCLWWKTLHEKDSPDCFLRKHQYLFQSGFVLRKNSLHLGATEVCGHWVIFQWRCCAFCSLSCLQETFQLCFICTVDALYRMSQITDHFKIVHIQKLQTFKMVQFFGPPCIMCKCIWPVKYCASAAPKRFQLWTINRHGLSNNKHRIWSFN